MFRKLVFTVFERARTGVKRIGWILIAVAAFSRAIPRAQADANDDYYYQQQADAAARQQAQDDWFRQQQQQQQQQADAAARQQAQDDWFRQQQQQQADDAAVAHLDVAAAVHRRPRGCLYAGLLGFSFFFHQGDASWV